MPCLGRMLKFYGIFLAVVPCSYAQTSQMFEWGFTGDQSVSTSLPSCRSLPLEADARTADGIPPFYMMAFAVGGTPSTSFIGTNESNLIWNVTYPVGTQLVLGVVDSQGHSGGIDSPLYTVTDGATTQCVPATTPEPSFQIRANVSDVLNTCQPWGLTIEGGASPYNVTIVALNSPNVTNVTLGPTDTVFTYVNRMSPGSQIIASASDMNGRWATGSPLVRTQGSPDIDCVGLVSTSSGGQAPNNIPPKTHSMSLAKIGIIAGASAAALLVCGIIIFVIVRQRRTQRAQRRTINITPFFEDWFPRQRQTGAPLVSPPSTLGSTSKTGSRHMSELEESRSSHPSHSRVSVPAPVVVTELPPPYPNFLRYDS